MLLPDFGGLKGMFGVLWSVKTSLSLCLHLHRVSSGGVSVIMSLCVYVCVCIHICLFLFLNVFIL